MSLLDDMIVNTAAVFEIVGRTASGIVEKSKTRVSSAELKSKISSQFEHLGRYVYDTAANGTTDPTVISEYSASISDLIGELKSLQDSLSADSGKIVCPKCCTKNSSDSLFCKRCGSSLDFANSYTMPATIEQPAAQSLEDNGNGTI